MGRFLKFFKLFRKDLLVMLMSLFHRDTPWKVKGVLAAAILYMLSPVDIVPDALPLAGVIDDMVVLPAAVYGVKKLLPPNVLRRSESMAAEAGQRMPLVLLGAGAVIVLWLVFIVWAICRLFA